MYQAGTVGARVAAILLGLESSAAGVCTTRVPMSNTTGDLFPALLQMAQWSQVFAPNHILFDPLCLLLAFFSTDFVTFKAHTNIFMLHVDLGAR